MVQQVAFEDGPEEILSAELLRDSLPNNWRVASLGEISKATSETINPLYFPEEVFEYYSIPAFQERGLPVYEKGKQILSNKLLIQENTVLFGKLNPRVLKVWLVESTSKSRKIASTEFIPILANNDADPKFVYYICQSNFIVESAKRLVSGSTPSRQRVDLNSFYQIPIPLPPLPEQCAIAQVLRTVQESIQTRQRELELECERKAALMEYLFTYGTRNEPLKQTEIGEIPQSWSVLTVGDVITLQRGFDLPTSQRKQGKIPVVSSSGISGTHAVAKVVGPGVVTGRYGTIGQVFYIESDFWPLNTTLFVKDFKGNDPKFISYFLQTINMQILNDKTSVPGINRNDVHAIHVSLATLSEQREIAEILSKCDSKIASLEQEGNLLEELFRALLEELMTGRLSTISLIETEQVG